MKLLVLGCDPGITGACSLLSVDPDGGPLTVPKLRRLVNNSALVSLREMAEQADVITLEAQQASPQMGRGSAYALGHAAGMVEGVLIVAANAAITRVYPTQWRGSFGLAGGPGGKEAGMALAIELLGGDAGLIERHDQADAVLLAWWGWRQFVMRGVE